MKYRREIDGLRAVAVLPVIMFHAGFKAFEGGFVGVDVFFVISGYLITTIILSDMNNGKFSIVTFYERRARRILPALFFVMLCCLPLAWLWLSPKHLSGFSESLLGVSAFSSNILFWLESGYFGTASELKPLLHTWSLSVEEQYYVLFPLYLMALWKLRKRWIFGSLIILASLSLIAAQWGAYNKPLATFFLLPTRGWELAIGALIAFYFLYKREHAEFVNSHKNTSEVLGLLGLALICYSIFTFNKATPFPSLYALIPTIGTALIITFSTSDTISGRLLSTKTMVGIGLISYSSYLWHQPLFAFARHRSLAEPSVPLFLSLSALSIVFAYFSWRFVEMPFRNKLIFNRKKIFVFAVIGSFFFAAAGLAGHLKEGFPERFEFSKSLIQSFERSSTPLGVCFGKSKIHEVNDWYCNLGDESLDPSFVVFGDSHALSFFDAFDYAGKDVGAAGIFTGASGCTPFLGVHALRRDQNDKNCNKLNERVFNYIVDNKIKNIFLVARWTYYTDGGYNNTDFSYIGLKEGDNLSMEKSREAFVYGYNKTIDEYEKKGVKVFIVPQVPQQKIDAEKAYKRAYQNVSFFNNVRANELRKMSILLDEHMRLNEYTSSLFKTNPYPTFISFDNILCDSKYCPIGTEETSYYFDDDHLSILGSMRIVPSLEVLLK